MSKLKRNREKAQGIKKFDIGIDFYCNDHYFKGININMR